MHFAKLHGLGNDFVLVDLRGAPAGAWSPDAAWAARVCDRHRGIGADGVLALLDALPSENAPGGSTLCARLVIHNSDGSRPEMCGNGARCAALWIATDGCTRPARSEVLLLTDAGPRLCRVEAIDSLSAQVEVDMGPPRVEPARAVECDGLEEQMTPVSMGNPHRVIFPVAADAADLAELCAGSGPKLCAVEGANIEFARAVGHQRFVATVWERGAGATQACGTGACAVAAAAIARGLAKADEVIVVELPGGTLCLRMDGDSMKMRGEAVLVFHGELAP